MIGIKVISNTNFKTFEDNVEKLLAEHPDAKVMFGAIKGIEGGKGLLVVFSFEKAEAKPLPKVDAKEEALEKARAAKAEAAKKAKEAKKVVLEKQLAELEE